MSLFDKNIEDTPVTARLLQDIISERKIGVDDAEVIRYNKILYHILNLVRYNPDKDIWEHRVSLADIGIKGSPFSVEFSNEVDKLIKQGMKASEIAEWINIRGLSPCERLSSFAKFFKDRGFQIYFRTGDFLKSSNRHKDKLVTISWEKE